MAHPTNTYEQTGSPQRRRNDRGLTTLEWLLIVAAVAGLAALAVVLVQNVVDETAEQISGSSARLTAANVAAAEITSDSQEADPKHNELKAKCERLNITYGDALREAADPKKPTYYSASAASNTPKIDKTAASPPLGVGCHFVDITQ